MSLRSALPVALFVTALAVSSEAEPQPNDLPSRHARFRLTLARVAGSQTASRSIHYGAPLNAAPYAPVYGATAASRLALPSLALTQQYPHRAVSNAPTALYAPTISAALTTGATPNASFTPNAPLALGAYFYQNGECAPGDAQAVSAWRAATGRMPAVWMIYQGWSGWNQFPVEQARRARELGGRLQVTWEPWSGNKSDANWSCARVARGGFDTYIRQYARAVKASGIPVMLRFAHEMNGDWYPWGTAYESGSRRHNGNSPQQFVAMWRRVVSIFRQEGATNVSWVWSPNIFYLNAWNSTSAQSGDLAALYPGDKYVDWIGVSVYNDGARRPWNSFSALFEGAYSTVTQLSRKPLMIAELGATEAGAPPGTSKAQWIEQAMLREIPSRFPRVRLVTWFCRDKTDCGEANYRFDSSLASLRAFQIAANSPLYAGRLVGR